MSRTKKGSKGPGHESWSNRHERQKPASDPGYVPTDAEYRQWAAEDEAWTCYLQGGCEKCENGSHADDYLSVLPKEVRNAK